MRVKMVNFHHLQVVKSAQPGEKKTMPNQLLDDLTIDCVQLVKDHNSYERAMPEYIANRLEVANVLELDVWAKGCGDWWVCHGLPCAGITKTLSDYLSSLKTWHDDNPNHDVLWINIDFKDDWLAGSGKGEFETLIREYFSNDVLYRPKDLKSSKDDCRTAAADGDWPTFGSLNGRVIVVLTGGPLGRHNQHLSSYVKAKVMNDGDYDATSFVAPDVDDWDDTLPGDAGDLDGINKEKMHVVMFNAKWGNRARVDTGSVALQKLILWFWDVPEDDTNYGAAVQVYKASVIGTANRPEDIHLTPDTGQRGRNVGYYVATFYEDDNGWEGHGDTMNLGIGKYSYKGRGGWNDLPSGWNDEVRAVDVPDGVTVYMTDKDSFKTDGKGTVTIDGPDRVNINDEASDSGLAGNIATTGLVELVILPHKTGGNNLFRSVKTKKCYGLRRRFWGFSAAAPPRMRC
jgi:Phosphoinositide phospholipase C, Ca2+-dependent